MKTSVKILPRLAIILFAGVLAGCGAGIGLRGNKVLTGLFDNKIEDMEAAFELVNEGMTWEKVQEIGFKEYRGLFKREGPDTLPWLCGNAIIHLSGPAEQIPECARDFKNKVIRIWHQQDTRVRGKVGVINWQELNSGTDRRYLIEFVRGENGSERVVSKRPLHDDPIGIKVREAADFIIGGASGAVSGAGSEFGKDAVRKYSPFR